MVHCATSTLCTRPPVPSAGAAPGPATYSSIEATPPLVRTTSTLLALGSAANASPGVVHGIVFDAPINVYGEGSRYRRNSSAHASKACTSCMDPAPVAQVGLTLTYAHENHALTPLPAGGVGGVRWRKTGGTGGE